MEKWADNKAWFLVLPVFVVVAFSAIIPLMTGRETASVISVCPPQTTISSARAAS